MSRIYFDTNAYIYFLDARSEFGAPAQVLWESSRTPNYFKSLHSRRLLVKPLSAEDAFTFARISHFFRVVSAQVVSFTPAALTIFTQLRARHRVPAIDAVHLSCAAAAGVDFFVTNDLKRLKLRIPGIGSVSGLDTKF